MAEYCTDQVRTTQVSGLLLVPSGSNHAHIERVSESRDIILLELYLPLESGRDKDEPTYFDPWRITRVIVFALFRFEYQTLYGCRDE
jgi:hypothetical protein